MDVWQLIARDHENIGQLIHEAPFALNGPGVLRNRERLLADLMDQLEAHGAALDASLYAPLRQESRTQRLIEELRRERQVFMKQLASLAQYRRRSSAGWLDTFEDTTALVDQYFHRHNHEFIPLARKLLPPEEARSAMRVFIRAKMGALKARRSSGRLVSGELALTATISATAVGLGLLAWRASLFSGLGARTGRLSQRSENSKRPVRGAFAVAPAPNSRSISASEGGRTSESPYAAIFRRVAHEEPSRYSEAESELGSPAGDVLYTVRTVRDGLRELVLPTLTEASEAWAAHGYQVYVKDETLSEHRDRIMEHPRVLFRIARATLPTELVAKKGHLFVLQQGKAENEVLFGARPPGSSEEEAMSTQNTSLRSDGELTPEKLQDILGRALKLALTDPL
jgi:hypothetical protein